MESLIKYVEEESRKRLSLAPQEVLPLGFRELANIRKLNQPITLPLRLKNAKVISSDFDEIVPETRLNTNAILNSTHCSTTLALLQGGWLPSGLAVRQNSLLLPDRCTIGAIRHRFVGGNIKSGHSDDFLDLLKDYPIKINPVLYILEGNSGKTSPSESQLPELYDKAVQKIQEALPAAVILPDKASIIQGCARLLRDTTSTLSQKQAFLVKAAPLAAPSISKNSRPRIWLEIFTLAKHFGINSASTLMVALLSATAARQDLNPAKKWLKPKNTYTESNAFNALSDLRALDVLIAAITDFPEQHTALLTNDIPLAQLWAGLQAHSYRRQGNDIHYTINPHSDLFSNLSDSELQMLLTAISTGQ